MNITLWLIALRIAQSGHIHCVFLGSGPCFVFFQCDFQVYVAREPAALAAVYHLELFHCHSADKHLVHQRQLN